MCSMLYVVMGPHKERVLQETGLCAHGSPWLDDVSPWRGSVAEGEGELVDDNRLGRDKTGQDALPYMVPGCFSEPSCS